MDLNSADKSKLHACVFCGVVVYWEDSVKQWWWRGLSWVDRKEALNRKDIVDHSKNCFPWSDWEPLVIKPGMYR